MRGQYDGYLDTDGVAAGSTTETYAALRLDIDNWRWSGVPFFIRTAAYTACRKNRDVSATRSDRMERTHRDLAERMLNGQ